MTAELREAVAPGPLGPSDSERGRRGGRLCGSGIQPTTRSENIKAGSLGKIPHMPPCVRTGGKGKQWSGRREGGLHMISGGGTSVPASTPRVLFPGEGSLVFAI